MNIATTNLQESVHWSFNSYDEAHSAGCLLESRVGAITLPLKWPPEISISIARCLITLHADKRHCIPLQYYAAKVFAAVGCFCGEMGLDCSRVISRSRHQD